MGMLKREDLLKREELEIKKVDFENGDFVYVREMYGREKNRFERSIMEEVKNAEGKTEYKQNLADFQAKLAIQTLCDESGVNLMKPADAGELSKNIGAKRLDIIVTFAQELNKITKEDKEKMLKNSGAGETGDSSSDSVKD